MWPTVQRNADGHIYVTFDQQSYSTCEGESENVQLLFLDGRFVECASIEISEERLRSYEGGNDILGKIYDYLQEYMNNRHAYQSEDFAIESILLCSDGHIYINLVPENKLNDYWRYEEGSSYPVFYFFTVTAQLIYKDGCVSWDDIYCGYRERHVTKLPAFYPNE